MHTIENKQALQEESPVKDTVEVLLRECQTMKEALEYMVRKKKSEIEGKEVIEHKITPQSVASVFIIFLFRSLSYRLNIANVENLSILRNAKACFRFRIVKYLF